MMRGLLMVQMRKLTTLDRIHRAEKQKEALDKLLQAEENFLLELGWKKNGKHFSPPTRVSCYDPRDKLFLDVAVEAQKNLI